MWIQDQYFSTEHLKLRTDATWIKLALIYMHMFVCCLELLTLLKLSTHYITIWVCFRPMHKSRDMRSVKLSHIDKRDILLIMTEVETGSNEFVYLWRSNYVGISIDIPCCRGQWSINCPLFQRSGRAVCRIDMTSRGHGLQGQKLTQGFYMRPRPAWKRTLSSANR